MQMIPVDSSNLASVGYENRTLYIAFNSGGLYSYAGVPESIYQELLAALSKGKFFHAYIKGVYPYQRIG